MSTNEKLSDEIAKYFHAFEKCAYDSPDEIIEAVQAAETEIKALQREKQELESQLHLEVYNSFQLIRDLDDARDAFRTLDYELNKRTDKLLDVAKERDAARADADYTAAGNRRFTTERDAALAKAEALDESIIGVRQQRDRFAAEAAEWEKRCKTVVAKLATVREWSKVNSITCLATDRLTAILDMPPTAKNTESSAVCAEYDIVEKAVVLWRATKSQMLFVDEPEEMELLGGDQYTELARTTVQFRVPRPAKKTLAERLQDWDSHGGSVVDWDAIVAVARGLEGVK